MTIESTPQTPPPNQTAAPSTPPADQPKVYAGKFKSEDDLYKGVTELRKQLELPEFKYSDPAIAEAEYSSLQKVYGKIGQAKGQPTKLSVGDLPTIPDDFDMQSAAAKTGLNKEEVYKHYTEKGDLSDEHFAAIRKEYPWMSRKVAANLIEGEIAKAQVQALAKAQVVTQAIDEVGGDDAWKTISAWASEKLDPKVKADINKRLDNSSTTVSAARELAYLYSKDTASQQQTQQTNRAPIAGARNSGGGVTVEKARELARAALAGDMRAATQFANLPPEIHKAIKGQ